MGVTKTSMETRPVLATRFLQQWRQAGTAIGVTGIYVLSAWLGLKLAVVHGNVTAIWPPSGIALAALLLFGPRMWIAVAAGAFIANLSTGLPVITGLGIAAGNTLAAVAGLQLVRRFTGTAVPLDSVRNLLILLAGGALLGTLLSATVGTLTLALAGLAPASQLLEVWLTWWLGDATGVIIFAPLCLAVCAHLSQAQSTAGGRKAHDPNVLRVGEALFLSLALVFTGGLLFGGWFVTGSETYPLAFLPLPLLLWAGFRFGKRGASVAVATMSLLAIWGTVLGHGPFASADLNKSLMLLQVFMSVNAVTSFMLVAVLSERDAIRDGLQQSRRELEHRVQERTWALLEANRFLLDEIREHRAMQERAASDARTTSAAQRREDAEVRHVYEHVNRTLGDDFLSAAPDPAIFAERLGAALQYARITQRKAALMLVSVTDPSGVRITADESGLLQQVAGRLQSVLRDTDILARHGEDEFAILLEGIRELDDVAAVAERIIHELCIPFIAGQEKHYLLASVGISIFPDDATDSPDLFTYADTAMRLARERGGRKYHFHIGEREAIDARVNRLIGHN